MNSCWAFSGIRRLAAEIIPPGALAVVPPACRFTSTSSRWDLWPGAISNDSTLVSIPGPFTASSYLVPLGTVKLTRPSESVYPRCGAPPPDVISTNAGRSCSGRDRSVVSCISSRDIIVPMPGLVPGRRDCENREMGTTRRRNNTADRRANTGKPPELHLNYLSDATARTMDAISPEPTRLSSPRTSFPSASEDLSCRAQRGITTSTTTLHVLSFRATGRRACSRSAFKSRGQESRDLAFFLGTSSPTLLPEKPKSC